MNDFPPFIVNQYTADAVENFVREFTGGDARADIFEKSQIRYLRTYFKNGQFEPKTVVFETEYVDRTYLEDYTEYYATCFRRHPRHCARIHFFSSEFGSRQFVKAISGPEAPERKLLLGSEGDSSPYLGFVVIRPIPSTFFAKICLRPFKDSEKPDRKFITKRYTASLFGIELKVSTIALLEQDKVVAACATSALWALLNASDHLVESRIPSPSAITKAAMHFDGGGARTFPNYGLTQTQILRTLGRQGLDVTSESLPPRPLLHLAEQHFSASLIENVYAHLSNDTPALLGGFVYALDEPATPGEAISATELGAHLICVLGFKLSETFNEDSKYVSQAIAKLYVHDDRYGPYVRLDVASPVTIKIKSGSEERQVQGYLLDKVNRHGEILVPDFFAIGHSHKIRIPYKTAKSICRLLTSLVQSFDGLTDESGKELKQLLKSFYSEGIWDIALATNRKLKADPDNHLEPLFFNGSTGVHHLLLAPLPKYLWRCRLLFGDKAFIELLIDATEIPQGNTILGWISRSPAGELVQRFVAEQYVLATVNGKLSYTGVEVESLQEAVSSFDKFFRDKAKRLDFDELFGPICLPGRAFKTAEQNLYKNVLPNADIRILHFPMKGTPAGLGLQKENPYIWVIDREGNFRIAEDIKDPPAGHPTLVGGRAARVAGELNWNKQTQKWEMTTKSETYSWDINPDVSLQEKYLTNVQTHFFELGSIDVMVLPPLDSPQQPA